MYIAAFIYFFNELLFSIFEKELQFQAESENICKAKMAPSAFETFKSSCC